MSDDRERRPSAAPPEVRRAAHVTDDADAYIGLCADALSESGLHHVAEYRWGVFNYSADILDRLPADAGSGFGGTENEGRREMFTRLGRQLHYILGCMDHVLRSVDSGRLIRSVLQFGDGAVFHYYFRADDYLTGVSLGADAVEAGDRAMAGLLGAFNERIGVPNPNPGGFLTESSLPVTEPWVPSKKPHMVREGVWGESDPPVLTHCRDAVSAQGLHYAGYFAPGSGHLSADSFNHPDLSRFFGGLTRDERRTRYAELGERLHYVVARLNQSLRAVMPGQLKRVVLDVQEGALFYVDRDEGHFLLGVTLDQSQVALADRQMNRLVHSVSATTGEEPDEIL
ncbi:hypothetical protein AB0I00_03370 [Streptomyces sp. NPDC050803]|uniref:hypothetical protein n=1 Tax=unclassified Streptomyces TaxID=2593676 RepID=UPI003444E024